MISFFKALEADIIKYGNIDLVIESMTAEAKEIFDRYEWIANDLKENDIYSTVGNDGLPQQVEWWELPLYGEVRYKFTPKQLGDHITNSTCKADNQSKEKSGYRMTEEEEKAYRARIRAMTPEERKEESARLEEKISKCKETISECNKVIESGGKYIPKDERAYWERRRYEHAMEELEPTLGEDIVTLGVAGLAVFGLVNLFD